LASEVRKGPPLRSPYGGVSKTLALKRGLSLLAIVIGIAILLIVLLLAFRAESRERKGAARMWELRFPTLEEYHEEGDTFFSETR